MFATVVWQFVKRSVDLARIHVFAADREHIVDAAKDALWETRVSSPTRVRLIGPDGEIAGNQPDHRLRCTLKMRINGRSANAIRYALEALRVADFGVDDVLPAQQAARLGRASKVHPWS